MAKITSSPYRILQGPIITEKAAYAGAESNSVAFEVHPKATKEEIKKAVEKIFDVKVVKVRTINSLGKVKRVGAALGRKKNTKKAYISLAPGSSIDLIEGL